MPFASRCSPELFGWTLMRDFRFGFPSMLLAVLFTAACGPGSRCDQAVNDVREQLEECGIDLGSFRGGPTAECTEQFAAWEKCARDCYAARSCEELLDAE